MTAFGQKIKAIREKLHKTREDICGDESELSIRQLARIEQGISIPSLAKALYISNELGVSLATITEEGEFELPKRYKELKHLILRTPTYMNEEKIQKREKQFDEIFVNYYDMLPEDEKLAIDCLQASLDVALSKNINFGSGILNDYLEQIKRKTKFSKNDFIILDLYLICVRTSKFSQKLYDENLYDFLFAKVINQFEDLAIEDYDVLNQVLVTFFSISLQFGKEEQLEKIILHCNSIMKVVNDFYRMPILNVMEWKYYLKYRHNIEEAFRYYQKASLFAQMIGDKDLAEKIELEWYRDCK